MNGNHQTKNTTIATAFRDYYQELYKNETTSTEIQGKYLQHAKRLPVEEKEEIDKDITVEDLPHTIHQLNKNKSPGPAGSPPNSTSTAQPS